MQLGKLAAPDRFAKLSRNFFARLINRNLEYFISRAIADHVGPGRGVRSIGDYAEFRHALAQHCYEAALIVEAFSSEWYSKANWKGGITEARGCRLHTRRFQKASRGAATESRRCLSGSSIAAGHPRPATREEPFT